MTANGIYTNEAVLESKQVMRSRAFHVKTDGSIAHSLATDTVEFLFGAMTGDPVEPEAVELKKSQAKEYIDNLTGQDMSIIRLGEGEYCPNVLYKNVNKHDQMPVKIAISDIGYGRTNMRVPQEKIDAAKVNSPILVERIELEDGKVRYHAIYDFDVLIKATQQGETHVNAYVISKADLVVAKIVPETSPATEMFGSTSSNNKTIALPIDINGVKRDDVDEYKRHPDLMKALISWLQLADREHLPALRKLAKLSGQQPQGKFKVFRGFQSWGDYQENMGWTKDMQVGQAYRFKSDTAVISTSLVPDISRAFGNTILEIEIDTSKNDVLFITEEMYVAAAEINRSSPISQMEVVLLPSVDVQVKVVETTEAFNIAKRFNSTIDAVRKYFGKKLS